MNKAIRKLTAYYEWALWETEEGKKALDYIQGRGFNDETIRSFNLGYAPVKPTNIRKFDFLSNYENKILADHGHTGDTESLPFDKFSGRLIFPVRDELSRICGFGGRALDESAMKYFNTGDSPIYKKGEALLGIEKARKAIFERGAAILCEGYTDVLAFHQVGTEHAVACMGTYATQRQLLMIGRYSKNLFLIFDGDDAGEGATHRTEKLALEMGFSVNKVALPAGKDPAEVFLTAPGT